MKINHLKNRWLYCPARLNGASVVSFQTKRIKGYSLAKMGFVQLVSTVNFGKILIGTLEDDQLEQLLLQHRRSDGNWDVVVPSSGGKDSCFVAHKLKFEHHMNPLLVTWSPLRYTEIGRQNFDALSDSGFTVRCTPAGDVHRRLARLCLEEFGDAFHVFVLGQVYYPIHMAIRFGINLVFTEKTER